jgi:hypothetical protein
MKDSLPTDDDSDEMTEKEIDANLEASFPASDPPSWTLGSDHGRDLSQEDEVSPEVPNDK